MIQAGTSKRSPLFSKSPSGQHGFSLVELMVALVLGLIIMAGVLAVFSSAHNTQQTDTGLARLQENARFVINIISRETRSAGYLGCLRDTSKMDSALTSPTNFNNNFGVGVQGFEANGTAPSAAVVTLPAATAWTPALDASIPSSGTTVGGSDVLVIRKISDNGFRLVPSYTDAGQVFSENDATTAFKTGDILVATDCERATIFRATNITPDGGGLKTNIVHSNANIDGGTKNTCSNWGTGGAGCPELQPYGDGSEIAQAQTIVFYVRQDPGNAMPALYMARFGSGSSTLSGLRLADGVESMQILYGIDTTPVATSPLTFDRAERYMTAAQITNSGTINWANVVSVRISLLMRTVNEPGEQADQTADTKAFYDLIGTRVKPAADKNRRRVFTTTIQLRNRVRAGVS